MKLHVSRLRLPLALLALLAAATSVRALTTYYVAATGGSNMYDGQAPSFTSGLNGPLQTIQAAVDKMTNENETYKVIIRTGVYTQTVTLPSNIATNNTNWVVFEAYLKNGVYESVTISGADPVSGWTADTMPNVWVKDLSTLSPLITATRPTPFDENSVWAETLQVFSSDVMKPEARWPNVGASSSFPFQKNTNAHTNSDFGDGNPGTGDWSYVDSTGTSGASVTMTDAQLGTAFPGGTTFLAGGRVYIMSGAGWLMRCLQATSASNSTIVTSQPNSESGNYHIQAGDEYYVAGRKELLDQNGEWFYDSTAKKLYYYLTGGTAPANNVISIKRRNFGFDIAGHRYVTIQRLKFQACTIKTYSKASATSLMTNLADRCTFKYLTMKYPQHNGSMPQPPPGNTNDKLWSQYLYNESGLVLGPYCVLSDSEMAYASNRMIAIMGSDVVISKNNLHHSGYLPNWCAMVEANFWSDDSTQRAERAYISQNTFSDSGRAAIGYPGRAALVQYNDISKAMSMTTDGAAIYWGQWDAENSVIRYNRIHDCTSPWGHNSVPVRGFYTDSLDGGWIFHHNVVWNIVGFDNTGLDKGVAVQINPRNNYGRLFNNTFYNCQDGLLVNQANSFFSDGPSNIKIYNNILYNPDVSGVPGKRIGNYFEFWGFADWRNNCLTDPGFLGATDFRIGLNSPAKDQGLDIPGVTSGTPVPPQALSGAPDIGAFEYGAVDWSGSVSHTATTLSSNTYAAQYEAPVTTDANYPNLLKDGSFESGSFASPWSVTGSVSVNNVNAWSVFSARSGYYSAMFGPNSSTLSQTVSNLKPGKRYKFTCGVMNTDYQNGAGSTVTLRVSVAGLPDCVGTMGSGTGTWNFYAQPAEAMMIELPFINGSGTAATVKVEVQRPSGATNVPTGSSPTGVYVDDVAVLMAEDNTDPQPYAMPRVAYPFDEAAGSTTVTSSTIPASSFPITLNGASIATGGISGNALALTSNADRATSNLVVPASGTGNSFTLSFWWKPESSSANAWTIVSNNAFRDHDPSLGGAPQWWTANDKVGWALQTWVKSGETASMLRFNLCTGTGNANLGEMQFADFKNLSIGNYYHIAVIVDRSKKVLATYLNGQLNSYAVLRSQFGALDFSPTGNYLRFGSEYSPEAAIGRIDNFQAWDNVLTDQQIDNIYQAGVTDAPDVMAVPVHRLKFDEGPTATTMWDASGNKHHATITSGSGAALVAGGKISNLGNALAFNGATGNSAATVAGGTGGLKVPADSTKSFAVAFWINLNGFTPSATDKIATNDDQVWIHKGWAATLTTTSRMRFYLKSGSEPSNPGPSQYAQSGVLTGSGWQHAVIVVTQSAGTGCTITTYLDGVVSGTPYSNAATIDTSTTNALRLGGGGCKATIDDFRLYQWDSASEAMTAQEVLDLYKQLDRPPY